MKKLLYTLSLTLLACGLISQPTFANREKQVLEITQFILQTNAFCLNMMDDYFAACRGSVKESGDDYKMYNLTCESLQVKYFMESSCLFKMNNKDEVYAVFIKDGYQDVVGDAMKKVVELDNETFSLKQSTDNGSSLYVLTELGQELIVYNKTQSMLIFKPYVSAGRQQMMDVFK